MNFQIYIDYITNLISAFIKSGHPLPLPENIDAKILFAFCHFHKIENLVYLALKNTDMPEDTKKAFQECYLRSVNITAKQQYYIEKVEKAFEEAGIDYFVMKGRELSKLYPSPDMRQSADFDMYVGNEQAELARNIMINLGFSIKFYSENSGHDQYVIDKVILCELHRLLVDGDFVWKDECNKIPERVIRCENTNHCYRMNIEDFYLYNLAHAANHIKTAGIGIKIFIDLWLIYTKYKNEFDYTYLREKLESANLTRFEECSRKLFLQWFEGIKTSDETVAAMGVYIAQSGWIGTCSQYSSAKLAQGSENSNSSILTKLKGYWNIIFPSYENLVKRYPQAQKYKILVPFYYIYRIVKSVFGKDKGARRVVNEITTGDLEKGKYLLKLKKDMGL